MKLSAKAIIIEDNAILLVEFNDVSGLHYNFPGGTLEVGESLQEALYREVREEVCAEIEDEQLAFVYEYTPELCDFRYGEDPILSFLFNCRLKRGRAPKMPDVPDPNQTDVKWISLETLSNVALLPNLTQYVIYNDRVGFAGLAYIREHELQTSS